MSLNSNPERERLKTLLTDTVTLLCKNSLVYQDELKIEGVIGITLDEKDVVLVHLNEAFPTNKVMQPNITSTSGSRSNTPVRSDISEPTRRESHHSSDNSTSARSTPITQHMQSKVKHSETKKTDKTKSVIGVSAARNGSKAAKNATVSSLSGLTSSDMEEYVHPEVFPNIRSSPIDPLIPTEANGNVKVESGLTSTSEENIGTIQGVKIKTEPEDEREVIMLQVGDMKIVSSHLRNQSMEEDYFGKGSVFPEVERSRYEADAAFDIYTSETDRPSSSASKSSSSKRNKRKRHKMEGVSNSDTSDSEYEFYALEGDDLPKMNLSWPSTSEADKEDGVRKYPSCALSSKAIKQCLQSELILPLVDKHYWALAARMTWRNNHEQAWNQIVRTRQECDMTVGALDGVCFFLSAVTGLFRHSSTKGDTDEKPIYPGISYWVVFDGTKEMLNYDTLLSALNEMDLGCEVKKLITHGRDPTLTDISNALFICVKDHNNRCIRRKIDHSTKVCFGTAATKMPCVKFIINNMKIKQTVRQAHKELLKNNLESTLESWI